MSNFSLKPSTVSAYAIVCSSCKECSTPVRCVDDDDAYSRDNDRSQSLARANAEREGFRVLLGNALCRGCFEKAKSEISSWVQLEESE
jgi:hypothetical protein